MMLLRLLSRFPLRVLYRFSDLLFFLAFYLVRYRKTLVLRNLQRAFPDKTKKEIKAICKEFYRNLCDYAVETLRLLSISREELMQRVTFTNPGVLIDHLQKNQSVLVLASHTFNWEWLLVASSAVLPAQLDFVYQAQRSRLANRFSLQGRCRFGAYAIERFQVGRENLQRRNMTRILAIVADQYPGLDRDKKTVVPFLHQETAFFKAPEILANATLFPVYYAGIRKLKRGHYQVHFEFLGNPPFEEKDNVLIARYAASIERLIRERPAEWLWSHNRWKKRHLTKASASHPHG
jgi:KDO2-lipid IV(A) lauroyltransferase